MLSLIQKQREHEAELEQKQRDYENSFVCIHVLISELAELTGAGVNDVADALLKAKQDESAELWFPPLYIKSGMKFDVVLPDAKCEILEHISVYGFTDMFLEGLREPLYAFSGGIDLSLCGFDKAEFALWLLSVAPDDPLPPCLESELTKVRVTAGTIEGGGKRYAVGDTFNTTAAEAERLSGKGVVERAEPQPADQSARVQALEAERDQARQALADAEARAAAAERERDKLRERLAEIERQAAERPALEFLHPSARLLLLVAETQRKFWSDWKPGRGGNGCQDAALQWLKETHGLSGAEARAVESVAAPVSRDPAKKNPQG